MALPVRVALDTNMLLSVNELKIDIFQQIRENMGKVEFIVPKQVVAELLKLSTQSKKKQKSVLVANELIEKNNVKQVFVDAVGADEALLKLSDKAIIASNDRELKKAVKEKHGQVIFLRQKKFFGIC